MESKQDDIERLTDALASFCTTGVVFLTYLDNLSKNDIVGCVQIDGMTLTCSSGRSQHPHELFTVDLVIMSYFGNHPKLVAIAEGGLGHVMSAAL